MASPLTDYMNWDAWAATERPVDKWKRQIWERIVFVSAYAGMAFGVATVAVIATGIGYGLLQLM